MPRGYAYGDFVRYPDSRGFVIIGGFDGSYTKYPSNILNYDEDRNTFEYLPGKLEIPRCQFVAALVNHSSDCWLCFIEHFLNMSFNITRDGFEIKYIIKNKWKIYLTFMSHVLLSAYISRSTSVSTLDILLIFMYCRK